MGHLLTILFFIGYLPPHGDLHLRIVDVTDAIQKHPDSTHLYLLRGELYLQHEDFALAYDDFSFCLGHGLKSSRVFLGMSKSFNDFAGVDSALYYINLALETEPELFPAMEWKAYVLNRKEQHCAAASLYVDLIHLATNPSPSLFIDASQAWNLCTDEEASQKAILALTNGIARLGHLHVLEKELVRLYIQQKDFDHALSVQTDIIRHSANPAKSLFDRAGIYLIAGEDALAKKDLQEALVMLDELPLHKSNTPAMKEMRNNILSNLNKLDN